MFLFHTSNIITKMALSKSAFLKHYHKNGDRYSYEPQTLSQKWRLLKVLPSNIITKMAFPAFFCLKHYHKNGEAKVGDPQTLSQKWRWL